MKWFKNLFKKTPLELQVRVVPFGRQKDYYEIQYRMHNNHSWKSIYSYDWGYGELSLIRCNMPQIYPSFDGACEQAKRRFDTIDKVEAFINEELTKYNEGVAKIKNDIAGRNKSKRVI